MKKQNWLGHFLNFVAVILGVYLAFYINDSSQRTAERKEALLLMKSMSNELAADMRVFQEYHIPVNEQFLSTLDSLLSALAEDRSNRAEELLPLLFQIENYSPNTSVYNSMKSSGKLRLLTNLSLQKEMNDFYDGLALECMAKNEAQVEIFKENLLPWLIQNTDLMEMKYANPSELTAFQNTLYIYRSFVGQKVENYRMVVEDSRRLKEKLDSLVQRG